MSEEQKQQVREAIASAIAVDYMQKKWQGQYNLADNILSLTYSNGQPMLGILDSEQEPSEIQKIIKEGCAAGTPYPWCEKGECNSEKACWYTEASSIFQARWRKCLYT